MTATPDDSASADARQRVRDQVALIRAGTEVAADTEDDADFNYLHDPDHLLVREDLLPELRAALQRRQDVFDGEGDTVGSPIAGLSRYLLPNRRDAQGRSVVDALAVLDEELGEGRVTPDHFLHVTVAGTCCPATEPAETGLTEPWPPRSTDATAGSGIRVTVVDTGLHHPATTKPATPWLAQVSGEAEETGQARPELLEYEGHGTFVAGVVRCRAPAAAVHVERFSVMAGGAIRESDLIVQLAQTLAEPPHLINLSAGCRSRNNLPLLSFEVLWDSLLGQLPNTVLVAAAGNDGSSIPFWPAAFGWAVGVGSLDRNGDVSSFSNHGVSADVFALGRNHVNAFPDGSYTCREAPDTGDPRVFGTGLARWSGTSFAAPLVTGLIAARMYADAPDTRAARDAVLQSAKTYQDPRLGPVQVLPNP
ncbi:peptidase S8 and S53 subtilisin kexin sedolisin [Kribbella flavida DSM 17836]|uniref:Peptidase S8 and S53 subtilisin kexin sedolisin n=1 Tax=Kribbella flavida (strain DSM 17836 / JCM 10339 / NBRC 14399) TaxID=479435 RepID=D2PTU8_KRIFD|nr:S8/S53 family peptidase [Kribbella flavida]ADB33231.1 peptidase S8 and S53 subtilisin kexin sedolisin [Kribbella flavida DSM 17836]